MRMLMALDGAQYELMGTLGRGGFARAYRAKRRVAGEWTEVCLKIPYDTRVSREMREEGRLLAQIDDDSVVRFVDYAELEDGRVALALELVDGGSLAELLSRHPPAGGLSQGAVAYVGARVARALSCACRSVPGGLVHRDVSPQNVLVSRRGDVKLVDFGVARAWDREPWTGARCIKGKLSFASPEQLLGAELDERSDLFSLGVLLYEACSGRHPFCAGAAKDKARATLLGARPEPPPVSRPLAECILSLLERRPDDRPGCPHAVSLWLSSLCDEAAARGELAGAIGTAEPRLARCGVDEPASGARSTLKTAAG